MQFSGEIFWGTLLPTKLWIAPDCLKDGYLNPSPSNTAPCLHKCASKILLVHICLSSIDPHFSMWRSEPRSYSSIGSKAKVRRCQHTLTGGRSRLSLMRASALPGSCQQRQSIRLAMCWQEAEFRISNCFKNRQHVEAWPCFSERSSIYDDQKGVGDGKGTLQGSDCVESKQSVSRFRFVTTDNTAASEVRVWLSFRDFLGPKSVTLSEVVSTPSIPRAVAHHSRYSTGKEEEGVGSSRSPSHLQV